ncbi:orotidine-5'-phosphate decarboxylase [Piscicoccus intestinalis]|uniref:orotidine-5'-phosphate decarboxylase n=1 Tax=Piscicoccus intestinalis TaxID=746033 RepID=UPI000838AB1A|nr:orotidine-5'-phosphate decarboxylase [Piscicoccus intestinalis]
MTDDQTATRPFGARLTAAMDEHGPLCVGIDPHPGLLSAWELPDDVAGLERFAMACVEALGGHVACVKPQSAFFERHGSAGIAVLERVVTGLAQAGTLCLLDVKRGDIGSTMAGYAQAYLADGPLAVDAITVSPFLGYESLRPALDLAAANGRGVFVLTLTSNPEGRRVQHARAPVSEGQVGSATVAGEIIAAVSAENNAARARTELGSVGMVVGATIADDIERLGLDFESANGPLLAPGIGAQGGSGQELARAVGVASRAILASSSREVLGAGPDVAALRAAALDTAARLTQELRP